MKINENIIIGPYKLKVVKILGKNNYLVQLSNTGAFMEKILTKEHYKLITQNTQVENIVYQFLLLGENYANGK